MTNQKNTRKALLASVVSLFVCITMLIGSTFAWFTDTASTGINTITAGNLDIKLSYKNAVATDYAEVSATTDDLFVDATGGDILWEPGAATVCYFKLENLGTLALKYNLKVSYKDTVTYSRNGTEVKLSGALKSAVIDLGTTDKAITRSEIVDAVANPANLAALGYSVTDVAMEAKTTKYFALVIIMPDTVDNTYNLPAGTRPLEVQLGVDLVATQFNSTVENDSFDNNYDKFANYPYELNRTFPATTVEYTSDAIREVNVEERWTIAIPAGAIVVSNPIPKTVTVAVPITTKEDGKIVYTFSITDENGKALSLKADKPASITVDIGVGLENVKVNGVATNRYSSAGSLTFTAPTAGDYVITYDVPDPNTVKTAQQFVDALTTNFKSGDIISIGANIDMTGVEWKGIDLANQAITINGNDHIITGLVNSSTNIAAAGGLINKTTGGSTVIIRNLTFDGIKATADITETDSDNSYAGAIIGYMGEGREATFENVTIKNAVVNSKKYAAGFIAWNSGWNNINDGSVFANHTYKDCSLIDSTIIGGGSTAGVVGQAGTNSATLNTIDNFKATGNTIKGEDAVHTGLIVATANIGKVVITNCDTTDFSGNTINDASNNTAVIGRFVPGDTGSLSLNGANIATTGTVINIS